ncbi:sensor histidine kinase [Fontibacillus panacisegetis]|nr:HAMP domain-containing sensor histidine kinase [Fontibacillus panacisegetis]
MMKNRTKLWIIMLTSIVFSLILFIWLTTISGNIWNKGYDLNTLNAISQEMLKAIEQQNTYDKDKIQPILDQAHYQHPELRFEWLASDGSMLYDTSGEIQSYDFKQLADRFINLPNNLWDVNKPITLAYSTSKNGQPYYLFLSLSSDAMKQGQVYFFVRTIKALYSWALPLLLSFLVPYMLSLLFFSSVNRRIGKLNQALNLVNIRSDVVVLEDKSKDEIGQLTRHYNSMAQRVRSQADEIEQFENGRKLLLSNLSHDLRTPLTMILGYAETIHTGSYNNENELKTSAKIILQRSRYMDKLLDQLLDIARLDANALEVHLAAHNLSEMMRKIVAEYMLFLDEQSFSIDVDIPDEDIHELIDAPLIERAIRNLLDNAIRYGKDGHFLGIGLVEEGDYVCITIKDKGRGIAPEDHELIFERFYRVDGGRSGEGLGIGLSIVKEIVESHQGHIRLISTPHVETLFMVRLPKNQ